MGQGIRSLLIHEEPPAMLVRMCLVGAGRQPNHAITLACRVGGNIVKTHLRDGRMRSLDTTAIPLPSPKSTGP